MNEIMESLMALDDETLNAVLESMSDEELDVINGYIDELDNEPDDDNEDFSDENWATECIDVFMELSEEGLIEVLESMDDRDFEMLEAACEKAINFDQTIYNTRHNPAKFVITPDTLREAGIPDSRVDEMFDILVDYMADKKYLTWGRKELPEGIAAHIKEERKITARNITEFGWRYFKKAKAMLLKASKSGDGTDINDVVKNANKKALTAANVEVIGKSLLELIGSITLSLGGGPRICCGNSSGYRNSRSRFNWQTNLWN